jgi:Transglycosylase SLT domain
MSERSGGLAHRPSWLLAIAMVAVLCSACFSELAAAGGQKMAKARLLPGLAAGQRVHVQTVAFADPRRAPVKVIRGDSGRAPAPRPSDQVEIVSFGSGRAQRVTVVRGLARSPTGAIPTPARSSQAHFETVAFADPHKSPVTIVRGPSLGNVAIELFGPANGGELDRIAFAVDGIESRHGADPGMWRPEPSGPQGPMQVSLAAALDVGGGDRFDLRQNRLLGRAYLAQLYRRYGNWADALAAYNWGPSNLDQWIAGGRRAEMLPLEVGRYVERALRDALLAARRF